MNGERRSTSDGREEYRRKRAIRKRDAACADRRIGARSNTSDTERLECSAGGRSGTYLVRPRMLVVAVPVLEHPAGRAEHGAHREENGERRHAGAAAHLQPHSSRHHGRHARSPGMTHTERARRQHAFIWPARRLAAPRDSRSIPRARRRRWWKWYSDGSGGGDDDAVAGINPSS